MTTEIDRPCKVGQPKKYVPDGFAAHKQIEKALYVNATAKWIGSVLSTTKVADERVYYRTVTGVYVGLNHESETEMIIAWFKALPIIITKSIKES